MESVWRSQRPQVKQNNLPNQRHTNSGTAFVRFRYTIKTRKDLHSGEGQTMRHSSRKRTFGSRTGDRLIGSTAGLAALLLSSSPLASAQSADQTPASPAVPTAPATPS